ncbi:MAG: type VII secretion protein EssC [Oscillospiraceae bacterium]|jgi:S-DNA-T family DNA segregation ATPase FtsK/SpoIIIE|nr:type VII secretion protein EssC [Oscillospiraceae bacterium]
MPDIKNGAATDFLATFFIENRAITKKLSDVIKNRENSLFRSALGLSNDFVLPFLSEESANDTPSITYSLRSTLNSDFTAYINDEAQNHHVIASGDYVVFKNQNGDTYIRVLFLGTNEIKLGYKKYALNKGKNLFIGRQQDNDISFDFSDRISREKHIAIRMDENGDVFAEDLKRSIGVYVNGKQTHSQKLSLFDEVTVMGLSLVYLGGCVAVRDFKILSNCVPVTEFSAKAPIEKTEVKYFVRNPRILKSLDTDPVEIDAPPNPPSQDKTPAILVLGPSVTMSLVMMASLGVSLTNALSGGDMSTIITSGVMAVGMLIGSLLWPALLRSYQKRAVIAEEKHRRSSYTGYISEIDKKLYAKSDRTIRVLNETFSPTPEQELKLLDSESGRLRLWERSFSDEDFLRVRLGLGQGAFGVNIATPKVGFQLHEDELRKLPVRISEKYSVLSNVPVTLDLKSNRAVGLIGSAANIHNIINEIILNLISLHSYDEVKLAIVCSEKESSQFIHLRNIPHIWSDDKKIRYFATNNDEVHYVFNAIDDIVKEREKTQERKTTTPGKPHFVLVITDGALIEGEPLLRYIENPDNAVGITSLFSYGDISKLPKACKAIIQSDNSRSGYYAKNENNNRFIEFVPDTLQGSDISRFARRLAALPVKVDAHALGVPERITFLQTFKAGNVDELAIEKHWNNNNSAKSLSAQIGVMAGGNPFSLDIHEAYHGCHGLVAGTTGSGKSEFLQAFVLSLAINYSPKEIAFVLVDFKGGDMARPFMEKKNENGDVVKHALPHLAAIISNLSGNLLYRALVSFNAEIKYRQTLFNKAAAALGVDKLDINSYHKYYKAGKLSVPLPHLVIIIDEFAQLKTQQPDFLAELINVAQVGRSLGIHLILATQKPSGVVDPQIWSNSRFKVCLKVADKQDSIDMINKPDSALIKNPGRCYVQVGYDEVYECVQSGYSGADYVPTKTYLPDDEITVQMTDSTATPIHSAKIDFSANKTDKTQLEAVVASLITLGTDKNLFVKPLWKDMLPERIALDSLQTEAKTILKATVALTDFVRVQEQRPLAIDFAQTGHLGIYGASGTGKTTFLQTLIYSLVCDYSYTPDELTIYAMDFGGRSLGYLNALPHVGDVVFEDNEGKIAALADTLQSIIDERKRIFAASNCGTFVDYHATGKQRIPAVLVLIDNFAPFHEKHMDLSERFFGIISAGKTYGVYFVITGNTRNAIYYKVAEHISTYFMLKMNDPGNYFDVLNLRPPITPEDIKGRGITVIDKEVVEFQVALALDGESESERVTLMYDTYVQIAEGWTGTVPLALADDFVGSDEDYSETSTISYTYTIKTTPPDIVSDDGNTLVLGKSPTGASLYGINLEDHFKCVVCANENESLNNYYKKLTAWILKHENRKVFFVDDASGVFSDITSVGGVRYIRGSDELDALLALLKPELNSRLDDDSAGFGEIFIILSDFGAFFDMLSDEQADVMRKITRYIDLPKYKMCFICGFNVQNDLGEKSNDRLFTDLIVNAVNYVVFPKSYDESRSKIENFPLIHDVKNAEIYFCQEDKNTKIRW